MAEVRFEVVTDGVPDFRPYYAFFSTPYNLVYHQVTPFQIGDQTYVIIDLSAFQIPPGQVVFGSTPNRELIFRVEPSGRLVDVTTDLMGLSAGDVLSLKGAAGGIVVADVNADGQPDIIIAANREDARASVDASDSNKFAQSQVHLSQPDGTYKLVDLGEPIFGGSGSIQVVSTGASVLVYLAGINAPSNSIGFGNDEVLVTTRPVFRLNATGDGFEEVGQAPTNGGGSVVLSENSVVTIGYNNTGQVFALAEREAGDWILAGSYDPFPSHLIENFVAWNDEYSPGTPVRSVDGVDFFQGFYGIFGQIVADPTKPPVILANVSGSQIDAPRPDGRYHMVDGKPANHFFFLEMQGESLVTSNIKIIGENEHSGPKAVQFLDLDQDGLTDISATDISQDDGGRPEVYLNDGHGHFIRVDPSIFPDQGVGSGYSTFLWVDGRYDLLVTPSGAQDPYYGAPIYEKATGPFPSGVFAMTFDDLIGNLAALQLDFTEGRVKSIALEGGGSTLAIDAAMLAAGHGVLGTIAGDFDVLIDAAGAAVVEGLAGHANSAIFAGSSGQYAMSPSLEGLVVSVAETSTLLRHVQSIQFDDASFSTANLTLQDWFASVLREDSQTGPHQAAASALINDLDIGSKSPADVFSTILTMAGATASVATLAYQFFIGQTPSAAGMDYLVSPTGPNANNLNSAYYQYFSLENRYINFAVNLGVFGEGAESFEQEYGNLSLFDATREAYRTIFGGTPSDAKIHALLDPAFQLGEVTMTRAEYFTYYGQTEEGTKAAMVGWLLGEAVKADIGLYAKSNDAFLTDVAVHDALFGIDLIGQYGSDDFVYWPN
ncbi:MAG: hypothetical protein IT546_02400 [Caulobacteraceae bacterium]|nr:hypothetical protein [Caulobacteraceae bacterium]